MHLVAAAGEPGRVPAARAADVKHAGGRGGPESFEQQLGAQQLKGRPASQPAALGVVGQNLRVDLHGWHASPPATGPHHHSDQDQRGSRRRTYCWLVYDHDPDEVELLGWEEFLARQWESIFIGYRSAVGRRKTCRRWSDLIEVGLGCSQHIADLLVRAEIIDRVDRDLEGTFNAQAVVSGMADMLADLRVDLRELGEIGEITPELSAGLQEQHARLLSFIRAYAFGEDAAEAAET